MAIICWKLWRWRCGEIFENEKPPLECKLNLIRHDILEMERAFVNGPTPQGEGLNGVSRVDV